MLPSWAMAITSKRSAFTPSISMPGTHGHAWHREPSNLRTLSQQALNGSDGYMPLNDVALNNGRVTGRAIRFDAVLLLHTIDGFRHLVIDAEPSCGKVRSPLGATPTAG